MLLSNKCKENLQMEQVEFDLLIYSRLGSAVLPF